MSQEPTDEVPESDIEDILLPELSAGSDSRLTIELLTVEVPRMHAGERAAAELAAGVSSTDKERELRRTVRNGERSKERIFTAALPLIRNIARREWRRRQQWGSTIPLEDLTQDAIIGFFKGLAKFRPEAAKKSSTNYLGQWMLVEMRRSAETMDHDLQVGHDAAERFRRIRALRSRLEAELHRPPTDEEISAASRDPKYVTRPGMVGRAPDENESAPRTGRGLTVAQIQEEAAARNRLGRVSRFGEVSDRDDAPESAGGVVDAERAVLQRSDGDQTLSSPESQIVEEQASNFMSGLISRTLDVMKLPEAQREIIERRYGLKDYQEESSAREISRVMGIHRERVSRVLNTFADEMKRPGGSFHRVVGQLDRDDLNDLGIGWVFTVLGEWQPSMANNPVPTVLTDDIGYTGQIRNRALYICVKGHKFNLDVQPATQVEAKAVCRACGNNATLVTDSAVLEDANADE